MEKTNTELSFTQKSGFPKGFALTKPLIIVLIIGILLAGLWLLPKSKHIEFKQALTTINQLETAMIQFAQRNGVPEETVRFLGPESNCQGCLDMDLSDFKPDHYSTSTKGNFGYSAFCSKKDGCHIVLTIPIHPDPSVQQANQFEANEFCKKFPVTGFYWNRSFYPKDDREGIGEGIECIGKETFFMCEFLEKQGKKVLYTSCEQFRDRLLAD